MVGNFGNWTPDADKSLACRPLLAIAGDGWNKALATSASAFCMPTSSSTSWRDVKLDQNHAISWSPPRQSPVVQRVACDRLNCAYSCINCTHTRSRETHTAHNTQHTTHYTHCTQLWRFGARFAWRQHAERSSSLNLYFIPSERERGAAKQLTDGMC